jgi:hypothetical protein
MSTRPPDPGSGAPGTGFIIFQQQSEQLLGGSKLQRVVEIGATTSPSDIYFQTRLPAAGYTRADGQNVIDILSGAIEDSLIGPYIVGMTYRQDINPAGQLLDQMEVFWSTPDESAQGSVVLPLARVEPVYVNPAVQGAVAPYLA